MLEGLLRSVKTGITKGIGVMRQPIRRIGQIVGSVGRGLGTAARFVAEHHQPISSVIKAAADASGNKTFQDIGNMAFMGSAIATGLGYGKDYGFYK